MNNKTFNIAVSSLFTAIICILSQFSFLTTLGVPLTMQTFAIALCGYVLKHRFGTASVAAYLALGACGVPVFSGFRGGVQVLLGPTGGFLFGFILLCAFCGFSSLFANKALKIIFSFSGLFLCHLIGIIQYCLVSGVYFRQALITVSLPFFIKDIILVAIAFLVSQFIRMLFERLHIKL